MSALARGQHSGIFSGLKSYSRFDVALSNLAAQMFGPEARWQRWVREGLANLLAMPASRVVRLKQSSQIDPADVRYHTMEKNQLSIGREPDNDVVLTLPGIGRHHAKLLLGSGGDFQVEDTGSANGTYINDKKLAPFQPSILSEGESFLVFPFLFTLEVEESWNRGESIRISQGEFRAGTWKDWAFDSVRESICLNLRVHPAAGNAIIAVNRELFESFVQSATHLRETQLVPSDGGVLELAALSILQLAKSDVNFPFTFSLAEFGPLPPDEPGVGFECTLNAGSVTGLFYLFLPNTLLGNVAKIGKANRPTQSINVSWPLFACLGYADIQLQELTDLETGDILLLTPRCSVTFPEFASGHGWHATQVGDSPSRLRIESLLEGKDFMDSEKASATPGDMLGKPDLSNLPVRVHVVLQQIDMSLAELNALVPGTIVELDRGKSEPVQLAVNGKITGVGELVDVEGRLGVRIVNWKAQ